MLPRSYSNISSTGHTLHPPGHASGASAPQQPPRGLSAAGSAGITAAAAPAQERVANQQVQHYPSQHEEDQHDHEEEEQQPFNQLLAPFELYHLPQSTGGDGREGGSSGSSPDPVCGMPLAAFILASQAGPVAASLQMMPGAQSAGQGHHGLGGLSQTNLPALPRHRSLGKKARRGAAPGKSSYLGMYGAAM
jgi:hypothetical protein